MEFRIKHEVDVHDVDYNGIARVSSIMRYIQSAAQTQLTANGMSYEDLRNAKRAFLLSKIKIDLPGVARTYDRLEAITYPCDSRGFSFLRCYKLMRDEEIIARAVSVWALIDTESRSLVRVNDFELGLPTLAPLDLELGRIKLPADIRKVGEYRVNYDDADQNRHMNNTKYPDMYSAFLPLDNKRIRSLTINYAKEAPLGCSLNVTRAQIDNSFIFRTLLEDGGINSEAEVVLEDI